MTVQTAIPDYQAAREAMVARQMRPQGVTDAAVVFAMGAIEREAFLPREGRPLAYVDRAVPIGDGRFMMPPAALGQILTQMAPEPGQRALVVGAGTGYSAAVLKHIGLDVVALECSAELAARARELGVSCVSGPLADGYKSGAPYDQILIDGAVEFIPDKIVAQLADGGSLGAAIVERNVTRLIAGRKAGQAFGYLSINEAGVPALPGFNRPQSFTF